MVEVEVFGVGRSCGGSAAGGAAHAPATAVTDARSLADAEVRRLCRLATAAAGVHDGHLAVEFVSAERIAELNARYRKRESATDVLAFPIDGAPAQRGQHPDAEGAGPAETRELGDVIICPEQASDLREAIVHGVLHLVGFDHEADDGEMLALQRRLLAEVRA
jgi:probable rRNA maturation factor